MCNGSGEAQKTLVDQLCGIPLNLFLCASFSLGSALELILRQASELVISGCHLKHIFFLSHVAIRDGSSLLCRIREDDSSNYFIFGQLMRLPLITFVPFSLLPV